MSGVARSARPPRLALAAVLVLGLALACAELPIQEQAFRPPTPVTGAVVSEHPLATRAGLEILEAGGNAADAAVATALALAVVYPQAGSLGGGGFAIWVPHGGGDPRALDFRETAPAQLSADDFMEGGVVRPELSKQGYLSVGVPGSPAGLWELARELGTLSFARLAEPAIRLARSGFPVDPWLAHHLRVTALRDQLSRSPAARRTFYPAGRALSEGSLFVQPRLAETLERLAERGPEGFYEGLVAESIATAMRRGGGRMTLDDLRGYRPEWRTPLRGWFRGYEVISMPPPSSGGVLLLQALRMLEGLPLDSERERARAEAPGSSGLSELALHWWIEALRRGFADRAQHLGDPRFWDVPLEELLSADWISQRRFSIGARATSGIEPLELAPLLDEGETTHLSVLDGQGNAVSLTTTLNGFFGSGVLVGEIGVLLNNEMDDFSIQPGVPNQYGLVGSRANAVAAGKRPLSSMTPTVVREDGSRVTLVLGAPGGPRIISAVFQVLLRLLVYGERPEDAVRAPRLHQQWKPAFTLLEEGWPEAWVSALEERGHAFESMPPKSSIQLIALGADGRPIAVSDPRRGGTGGAVGDELPEPAPTPDDPEAISASPTAASVP